MTPRPFTTLVSGLPRSGTSLVMQMLGAGGMPLLCDDARAPDADNPRGYFEYAAVRGTARDACWIEQARGRAVKVIHALLAPLPDDRPYRVLVLRREIGEVLASQDAMLRRRGEGSADALPRERLAAALSLQLAHAVDAFAARPRVERLDVHHAALLTAPAATVAEIDAFLGGGLDRGAMVACVEPALHRQRGAGP